MAILEQHIHPNFVTTVEVRESDEYTQQVLVKITKQYKDGDIKSSGEMFLSPIQLENLGRFLVRQAEEIKTAQASRESA